MPLPYTVLDDRTWQQLRDELVGRIGTYTPEWTDWGPSDPGITILELLAYLGENLLFKFNQIPEATQFHLLRLLQVPLRPAQPARGMVTFSTEQRAPVPVVEAGFTSVFAGNVGFEVEDDVRVLPVRARGAVKTVVAELSGREQHLATQQALDARNGLREGERPAWYRTDELGGDETAAVAEARSAGASVDGSLWVAVVPTNPDDAESLRAVDGPLGRDPAEPLRGGVLNLGVALPREAGTLWEADPCFGEGKARQGTPPQVEWRISTPLTDGDGEPLYLPLDKVGDTTRGLTTDGVVRLRLPARLAGVGVPQPEDPFLAGTGDWPPVLDDDPVVLFWLRAFPAQGAPPLGSFRWVGANAARVGQWGTANAEYVGTGTGMPNQAYDLAHRDVLADSLAIEVEEAGDWVAWKRVESFAASRRGDRHFVVDAEAGRVRFGDTVRGLAPADRIRALEYRYGGGVEGNVPQRTVSRAEVDRLFAGPPVPSTVPVDQADVEVTNPLPFTGGAEAETVAEGLERIPGELRRRDRAVTRSDFGELALATPGGQVARAECLPLFHPGQPAVDAPGVVTVVVWPHEDPLHPDAPRPDRALLGAVCDFLDRRRLVTTELYVVPPEYRRIAVSVSLEVKPGASPDAVRRWVQVVVRQYLSPLPPYGPEGRGWPLGRSVRAAELEAAALQVEGVQYLNDLAVAEWDGGSESWVPGTVALERWQAVEVASVAVVVGGPAPAPGSDLEPPPPTTGPDTRPVPIPVPPDVC